MTDSIAEIAKAALLEVKDAASAEALQEIKTKYLGRKGAITALLRGVVDQPSDERANWGKRCNDLKSDLEKRIDKRASILSMAGRQEKILSESIDVTLPGRTGLRGHMHPVAQIIEEMCSIFTGMGFVIADGPEEETDYYNFSALNILKDHPSRDMQDTFYIEEDIVLRTHTSPMQIRVMEKVKPPVRIISTGRVYRPDWDISHSPMFHQVEGFVVDKNITFANLKGILHLFLRQIFGEDTVLRFRPSFFPFTEPSAEVDIRCVLCQGAGCRSCSQSGWLEILGCGMIDPAVFANVGYDYEEFSGFAFGVGVERVAMLKYGISDIRLFFENDLRFLEQF